MIATANLAVMSTNGSEIIGAGVPPPGVTPNFENPSDNLRSVSYVTQTLTLVVVTAFVIVRFYAKHVALGNHWHTEDYFTFATWFLMVGYCITAIYATHFGGGLDQWEVPATLITGYFKACYAATIFYMPMAFCVKIALLALTQRVYGPHKKTIMGIKIFELLLFLYYGSGLIIKIRTCWPIEAYWLGQKDKCLNQDVIILCDSILSVISDLAILILPIPLTWSLELSNRKKLRIMGILCAGGTATAFSIYRLGMILMERNSPNATMTFTKVILSGNAEVGIGLICACLPAITALVLKKTRSTGYYSGNGGYMRSDNDQLGGPGNSKFHTHSHARSGYAAGGSSHNHSVHNHSHSHGGGIVVSRTFDVQRTLKADTDYVVPDKDGGLPLSMLDANGKADQAELVTHAQGVGRSTKSSSIGGLSSNDSDEKLDRQIRAHGGRRI
ncbi:hypothetical protein MGG_10581 [Pyricularia oryzae 70-15]|uniref:Rhodopsin domain-containing protein n=3 Tax=Pyricularia oryzae TaxID=318829 RepID=G4NKN8_PYRO7|nr:uncharacterized protein MGG_10581 [Pyricularia oryzae 70-15]EHA46627.1 hypothetical protein MGG_10581 [Pyricularia oryzae 70-15]ELQ40857.1 hypothetical protein OOU_Y34scaffold00334g27 [Pyricularia oryzae Y34]KAI7913696.1 hypothetical protein M0657_009878 [Pyricularia oryzae]KAI7918414.1 hypothetical protein M9X92_006892 [Pyricularia oryzae]